jgi:hypothetical protein
MTLHVAILGVFGIATFESTAWTLAYMILNESGQPYCCPFAMEVVIHQSPSPEDAATPLQPRHPTPYP